jgi:hypothetical protein
VLERGFPNVWSGHARVRASAGGPLSEIQIPCVLANQQNTGNNGRGGRKNSLPESLTGPDRVYVDSTTLPLLFFRHSDHQPTNQVTKKKKKKKKKKKT